MAENRCSTCQGEGFIIMTRIPAIGYVGPMPYTLKRQRTEQAHIYLRELVPADNKRVRPCSRCQGTGTV